MKTPPKFWLSYATVLRSFRWIFLPLRLPTEIDFRRFPAKKFVIFVTTLLSLCSLFRFHNSLFWAFSIFSTNPVGFFFYRVSDESWNFFVISKNMIPISLSTWLDLCDLLRDFFLAFLVYFVHRVVRARALIYTISEFFVFLFCNLSILIPAYVRI